MRVLQFLAGIAKRCAKGLVAIVVAVIVDVRVVVTVVIIVLVCRSR